LRHCLLRHFKLADGLCGTGVACPAGLQRSVLKEAGYGDISTEIAPAGPFRFNICTKCPMATAASAAPTSS
jgi:hypothetical protein